MRLLLRLLRRYPVLVLILHPELLLLRHSVRFLLRLLELILWNIVLLLRLLVLVFWNHVLLLRLLVLMVLLLLDLKLVAHRLELMLFLDIDLFYRLLWLRFVDLELLRLRYILLLRHLYHLLLRRLRIPRRRLQFIALLRLELLVCR